MWSKLWKVIKFLLNILIILIVSCIILLVGSVCFFPEKVIEKYLEKPCNNGLERAKYENETTMLVQDALDTILDKNTYSKIKVKVCKDKEAKETNIIYAHEFKSGETEIFGYCCAFFTVSNINLSLAAASMIIKYKEYGANADRGEVDTFFCISFPSYGDTVHDPNKFILWATEDKRRAGLRSKVEGEYNKKYGANYSICQEVFREKELENYRRDNYDVSYDGFVFHNYSKNAIVGLETWNLSPSGRRSGVKKFRKHYQYSLDNYSWKEKIIKRPKRKPTFLEKWKKEMKSLRKKS